MGKTPYSVQWRLIGTRMDACESDRTVEVFVAGEVVKTWTRVDGGRVG